MDLNDLIEQLQAVAKDVPNAKVVIQHVRGTYDPIKIEGLAFGRKWEGPWSIEIYKPEPGGTIPLLVIK